MSRILRTEKKAIREYGRELVALAVEVIYIAVLVLRCFGECAEYTMDPNSFEKSSLFDGEITRFEDGSVGTESEGKGECELMSGSVNLRSGAYKLTVAYDSVSDYAYTSIDNSAGRVCFDTENASVLKSSDIVLCDGNHEVRSGLWIRPMWGKKEVPVQISVQYNGYGRLAIRSVFLEEKRIYRAIRCVFAAMTLAAIDFLYLVFCKKNSRFSDERTRFVTAGILGITLFSSMTYLADFLNTGHDLNFHLGRIVSLAESIREFQLPHRMQFKMLNGYGYATPLFYGELFLLLPAVLYDFYVPLQTCYQIYVVAVNLATGIISFCCFRKIAGDWRKGLFGAAVYTLSAYRITDLTVRAAVGEYTAMAFFPLLFYGFWNLYAKAEDERISFEDCLIIVASLTGILNSHILSCEMLAVFIVPFMVIRYRTTFRKKVLLTLAKSGILSVLLNLWFIVPFFQSMRMNVKVSDEDTINLIEKNGIYLSQLAGIFHTALGGNVSSGRSQEMPLALGAPLLLGIVLFLVIYIQREKWNLSESRDMKAAGGCLIAGAVAAFFSSNFCRWDNLIYIGRSVARVAGMVEFSWRYLAVATLLFTIMLLFLARVIESRISHEAGRGVMVLIVAAAVLTEGHFMTEWTNGGREERVYSESDVDMTRFSSSDYMLQDTDREGHKNRELLLGEGIAEAEFHYDRRGKYYLTCSNQNADTSWVDVPVQAYDNYHARQDGGEELAVGKGENNRIRISIPGNFGGTICLRYESPGLWRVCELISLITACAIAGKLVVGRRNKNRREYCG